MKKYNLILVDDHTLFRKGLMMLLENCEMVGNLCEAVNGADFLEVAGKTPLDIALLDIDMPVMNGIEATELAAGLFPNLRIIALSMYGDEQYYHRMIHAGAKGFLLKDSSIEQVKEAIISVGEGGYYFSGDILVQLVKSFTPVKNRHSDLTEREQEVLVYICKGLSNAEIAEVLHVNKRTIDKHRENLLSKTQSKNTASLIMYAIRNKLVYG